MRLGTVSVLLFALFLFGFVCAVESATQQEVANYVRDNILGGSFGHRTLWMTSTALDGSYVCRDLAPEIADVPFPSGGVWWLVLIDDDPDANWGHACRWLFVSDNLDASTTPVDALFPPSVWANQGAGPEVGFGCTGLTGISCPAVDVPSSPSESGMPAPPGPSKSCLYAILISGGIRDSLNWGRYRQNLDSMKEKLEECTFPDNHITTLYKSQVSRDAIGGAIRDLCAKLDPTRDILFIYMSNHGDNNPPALCGWDNNGNGKLDAGEMYTPDQLKSDTEGCKVCRLYVIADQCYSGTFVSVASGRPWMSVYAAAEDNEPSNGSEYREGWTGEDPWTKSMDEMHDGVGGMTTHKVRSDNASGKNKLCECCEPTSVGSQTWGRIKVMFR